MLEGLVAGLLNRFLGMYVKNFDPAQLKVGIWSGDVKLRDLELRREALDQLKLPINVVEGHLGQLTLVIPWSNLRGAPVKVLIEDVFLLASPREEAAYDEAEEDERQHRVKIEKLDSAELLKERSREGLSPDEQKRSQSFTESLVTKIVDNLQVTVKNIHVRYEDSISTEGHPFALGLTLDEFSAVSTDAGWKPTFIQASNTVTHKLATLGALAVYWDTDTTLLGSGREIQPAAAGPDSPPPGISHADMVSKFKAMIERGDGSSSPQSPGHQFILRPVSGQAKIELNKSAEPKAPRIKALLLFEEIGVVLDDTQYRDALMMVDLFHYFIRHQEYKKIQPKGVTPSQDPRAWFRFAANAVLTKIHDRNRRWSWDYFRERRDDRRRYTDLFKKQKQAQPLATQEAADLDRLEKKLDYEDLRFWRSLARNQLRKENAAARKNQPQSQSQSQQQQQHQQQPQGWLTWVWGSKQPESGPASGGGGGGDGGGGDDGSENTRITEEQKKELFEAIEWDEKTALTEAVDAPRDSVQIQVDASLSTGSFTLRRGPHGKNRDLLSLHFDVLKASGLKRPDSLLASLSLRGLRVDDGTTPDSIYPEIVRVKDAPACRGGAKRLSLRELEQPDLDPFFEFELEQNPIDRPGDFALVAKLKPLEIVWNPNFVVAIVDFFRPPERHMESINALLETAGSTLEGLREQTRAGLEFALEEHKTINAQMDLQAPLIIVPASVTAATSTCLIIDAGHISINSELVDKATMKQIQSKQRQSYTDEDFERLESVMYDRFLVKLTATQVLIGPSVEETKSQLAEKAENRMLHIVERVNVDFVVETSILPKAANLARIKVSGRLPMLHAMVSDAKYKNLMSIMDVAIPKLDGDGDDEDDGRGGGRAPTQPDRRPSRPRLLSASSNRSRTRQGRDRRPSGAFQFLSQDRSIILDDDGGKAGNDDDDDDENFEDATDGTDRAKLKMQQRMFQLRFKVDTLKGSLYRSDPAGASPDQLLVELVAQDFALEFFTRPYDMAADVSLGSVTVLDFIDNPPAEFKSVVTSGKGGDGEDGEDRDRGGDGRRLVHVKFVRVNRQSPEFMTVYDGVEMNVTAAVSTINIIVTRKTLLTLLDFILVTFANNADNSSSSSSAGVSIDDGGGDDHNGQSQTAPPRMAITDSNGQDRAEDAVAAPERAGNSASIRVKVDLEAIRLILNNDGIRLATVAFNHADVGIFVHGKTMRVGAKLGDLSVVDDVNLGVPADSAFRKLVTIRGDDLADFRYETFDPANAKAYPGYDSSIFLRAGSVQVNFLEEPFRKLVDFLVKFGKMQAIFNAARQAAASQASQIQQSASRIKFDIVIDTPIVVFPRVLLPGRPGRDLITANLGEIYAQNRFGPLRGSAKGPADDAGTEPIMGMTISAGIRKIRLTSQFHYPDRDAPEELEMIDHVDLDFNINYSESKDGAAAAQQQRPDLEIEGTMSDINLRITQYQLKFLMEISQSVPAAFAGEDSEEDAEAQVIEEMDPQTVEQADESSRSGHSDRGRQPGPASRAGELQQQPDQQPDQQDQDQQDKGGSASSTDLGPELGSLKTTRTKLDLVFRVGTVGLELVSGLEDKPIGPNLEAASLSRFALNQTQLKTRILSDGAVEAELLVNSFKIYDSRPRDTNKFRKIMMSSNHEVQQLMASVTMTGGRERSLIAMATVDSPRVIFALDYLYALQAWAMQGLQPAEPPVDDDLYSPPDTPDESDGGDSNRVVARMQLDPTGGSRPAPSSRRTDQQKQPAATETLDETKKTPPGGGGVEMAFRINVVDAQVILIANPTSSSSEAIVLGTRQVLLSQQNSLTFQVSEVGMFLCRMDQFEDSRLRIIDDFSIRMSVDTSQRSLTSLHLDIEPLILRLSLRDILLALQILTKASELSGSTPDQKDKKKEQQLLGADQKARDLGQAGIKQRTASGRGPSTLAHRTKATTARGGGGGAGGGAVSTAAANTSAAKTGQPASRSPHHEELTATIEGIRVVLIGDLHELPILDLGIKRFTATAADWASNLKAETAVDVYTNVYNFSKSAWEPLVEPWQFGIGIAREQDTGLMSVELASKKTLDVTVTTATIALAHKSLAFLTREQDVLGKPRGVEAPYRIRNYTGFDSVMQSRSPATDEELSVRVADGAEAAWSFEHWEKVRENVLAENRQNSVTIQLDGSGFDPVRNVRLNREGEFLYGLRPKAGSVMHRLLVEVTLGKDNVKYVTLRSPLLIENQTELPVEIGVYDPTEGTLLKIEKVAPGESRPAPVGAAFHKSLLVRPDGGFGYDWSSQHLDWRDLLKNPTRTLMCKAEGGNDPFYFQLHARFDNANPLTRIYPYMRIMLSAPVTLENLLPYDFKYRIYDKSAQPRPRDWTNFLRKGGVSPVHVVNLSNMLLLSVDMQDTVFKPSEFAVVNAGGGGDLRREDQLVCRDEQGSALNLRLHYHKVPDGGGAFRVSVYSPYVILNKTGLDLHIRAKGFLQGPRAAAGQFPLVDSSAAASASAEDQQQRPRALPFMFSYGGEDHRNRALLKVADSEWSRPQSFDAIGSASEIVLNAANRRGTEIHVGLTVRSGEGKYKMTKVVTLAPRFVLKNNLGEELRVREPAAPGFMTLRPDGLQPLHFMQKTARKQLLCLCYPGASDPWTSPFNIADVGTTYVKLARSGQRQRLVRIDILLEDGTIFLHLGPESGSWPFSMRNESDVEFTFHQANPNLDEDGISIGPEGGRSGGGGSGGESWRPIRYRLPPRSIMPYAWDYPAARFREIIICAAGQERHIRLAEIGSQVPMKLPPAASSAPGQEQQQQQQQHHHHLHHHQSRQQQHQQQPRIIDINVAAQGPTQTLILSNFRPSRSLYRQKTVGAGAGSRSSSTATAAGFEVKKDQDSGITFRAQVQLSGIGISIVNHQLKELAYITLRDLVTKYSESGLYQTVSLAVKWIQIDNQLYGGIFPMILYPSVVPKRANEIEAHPSLHAMVTRVRDDSYGVLYIKYATVLLQQMTIELDEDFIFAVLDLAAHIPGTGWGGEEEGEGDNAAGAVLCDEDLDIPEPRGGSSQQGRDIYFEVLNIQPMQLDLSFMRTERVNAEDKTSSRNPVMFFLNVMTMALGNVNDAPVRFNALMLENVRVSVPILARNISNHYSQEVMYQLHKILGSADFLGNPVGLFNNISSGVTDIFYEPYQGLILSERPEEFGLGIAKGAASFVKKSVYGFSDSFSKLTGSLSKGLAAATMDKQFQDRRRITRARNRPRHALYGVTAGANSLVTSVVSGVGGLASKPFEGAEREGAVGFFKGVARGVVGLATKPAIGVLDMASNVSEGIRNTTTVFDGTELDRVRLARFVPADGIVRPYNGREALGQSWLKQADDGRYFDEQYVAHLELPREDMVVVVTFARILLLRSRRLTAQWDVSLSDLQTITKERTGINLSRRGGNNGPFIPVGDESGRAFLYRMIAVAVEEYNRRFKGSEG